MTGIQIEELLFKKGWLYYTSGGVREESTLCSTPEFTRMVEEIMAAYPYMAITPEMLTNYLMDLS